jgi:hypothetical protein|tara:strand:+ start:59 stop:463 length:405 start_codon:yes stop_codon:yes gene_type:complete
MKKLLMIMVMVLWCNTSFAKEFITFKNCYSSEFNSLEEDGRYDEHTFDIDKKGNTVVRTTIWNEEMMKKYEDANIIKIQQSEHKIKAIGKRFISTDFPNKVLGTEFVFDLKKYTIQTSVRSAGDIDTFTLICEK